MEIKKAVLVQFKDKDLNYLTSVNEKSPDDELKDYFLGTTFDRGIFPEENLQKCIKVTIHTTKIKTWIY